MPAATAIPYLAFEQIYDRTTMGALWAARSKLDPDQVKHLNTLWTSSCKSKLDVCTSKVSYKLSSSTPGRLGYGRYYGPRGSFEQLENYVRGTLVHKYYTDIDICNCHPTLMVQYARRMFDLEMPNMNLYVANREEFFTLMQDKHKLSKDDVKQMMMSVMYFGRIDDGDATHLDAECPPIFKKMQDECRDLVARIINKNDHTELYEYCRKNKKNIKGAFLSFLMQTEERKCLEAMVFYLIKEGFQVDCLAYDGLMIRRTLDPKTDEARTLLKSLSEIIAEQSGYNVRLAIKLFNVFTDILPADTSKDKEAYLAMKADFEKHHYYFQPTNTIVEITSSGKQNHYDMQHALTAFNTNAWILTNVDGTTEPFINKWRSDPARRIVSEIVCKMPNECMPTEISLFRGFHYQFMGPFSEDETRGSIEAFTDLVRCIAGDTEETYQYLLKSFARMIQQPLEKSNVCIILSSKVQGTGKDTLMLWISRIMGNHIAHYSSDDTFWLKYDGFKEGAILMYLEEAGVGENKRNSDALKARITEDQICINQKGLKPYTVPNIGNYFMTTNNVCPVKLEADDRRFLILAPSNRFHARGKEDKTFWTEFYRNLKTDAWLWSVGKYLETLPLDDFNPTDFPQTEIRSLLLDAVQQETPEEAFLKQWDGVDQNATEMYNAYVSYCTENRMRYKNTVVSFAIAITRLDQYFVKRRLKTGVVYSHA